MSKILSAILLVVSSAALATGSAISNAAFLLLVVIFGNDGISQALTRLAPVLAPVVAFLGQIFNNPIAIAILA